MIRTAIAATMIALPVFAGTAQAQPQLVGTVGLSPNAQALESYIMDNYPAVPSIGGVRPDRLPDHPSGHALDIMVYGNTALGNTIAADLRSNMGAHSIKYLLWQVPNHYNHVHVTVY